MAKWVLDLEDNKAGKSKIKKEKQTVLSPSKIESPAPNTTVDALVASLSPPRKSGRYFDGELTDGWRVIRPEIHRDVLESYYKTNRPVTLEGCRIQSNQTYKKLEVAIKDYTKISPSDVCEDGKSLKPVSTWRYNVNISLARNTIKWASSYQVYAECLLTAAKKWWLVVRVACPELRWLDYWRLTKSNAIGLPVLASHNV